MFQHREGQCAEIWAAREFNTPGTKAWRKERSVHPAPGRRPFSLSPSSFCSSLHRVQSQSILLTSGFSPLHGIQSHSFVLFQNLSRLLETRKKVFYKIQEISPCGWQNARPASPHRHPFPGTQRNGQYSAPQRDKGSDAQARSPLKSSDLQEEHLEV